VENLIRPKRVLFESVGEKQGDEKSVFRHHCPWFILPNGGRLRLYLSPTSPSSI